MRLIDADALKAYFRRPYSNEETYTNTDIEQIINNLPTIEERPQVEWKKTARCVQVDETDEGRTFETHFFYSCPVCGAEYGHRKPEHPFCKWCGTKMR
jgi:hypothetical protein